MRVAIAVWSLIAGGSLAWGGGPASVQHDTEGWRLSNGEIVADPAGAFVRLDLKVDRGAAELAYTGPSQPRYTMALEACSDYELTIAFRCTTSSSGRERGSSFFLYFWNTNKTDQGLGDVSQTFEPTPVWKKKTVKFKSPIGTARGLFSIRQMQCAGTLDIQSIELKTGEGATVVALSPAAVNALAWISRPGKKVSPTGESSPRDGNLFLPYLQGKAPPIVRESSAEPIDGVLLRRVVFRSMTVGGEPQDVMALIARPTTDGQHPGLLYLHGGRGCAESAAAIRYAQAGYVCVSPDLPGIADPAKCPESTGPWRERSERLGWSTRPDATANETFDAVVAALQAFDLLCAEHDVNRDKVGISGISMGGYTTTILSGLLGSRVKAAYSKFGCGFYDRGSSWEKSLKELPDDQRNAWLNPLDAGRRVGGIRAPYYVAAAARDFFFWPPAVNATVAAIPTGANLSYAPVKTHSLEGVPGFETIDLLFLGYYLKGEGKPFPVVTVESCLKQPLGGKLITFSVKAAAPVMAATLYLTPGGKTWEAAPWEAIAATREAHARYQVVVPANKICERGAWFINVSDDQPATGSSLAYGMAAEGSGKTLMALGIETP